MNVLHLDYQRRAGVTPWAGIALFVLAVTAMAATIAYYLDLSAQAVRQEARNEHLEKNRTPRSGLSRTSGPEAARLATEVRGANDVLHQLTMPWDPLFGAVEACASKEVSLLSLEPDSAKGVVKIGGEAKNLDAMLAYMQRLEAQPVFGTVYLQNHQVQLQDSEKPVRFSLLAAWRGRQ